MITFPTSKGGGGGAPVTDFHVCGNDPGKSVQTSLQSGKRLTEGGRQPNSIRPQSRRANYANANGAVIGKTKRTNTRGRPIKAAATDLGDNRTSLRCLRLAAPPLWASNSPAVIDCLRLRCESDRKSHVLVITGSTWLRNRPRRGFWKCSPSWEAHVWLPLKRDKKTPQ